MISAADHQTDALPADNPAPPPGPARPVRRRQPANGTGQGEAWLRPRNLLGREHDHYDMARLADGDEQGLDSLMRRHAKELLLQLQRIVRNRTDAEELVNETFIRVFRHRRDYDYQHAFSTWLYVIGSRLAISLLRWRARRPEHVPLPEGAEELSGASNLVLIDPALTPEEEAQDDEWTGALEEALARLPQKLRRALQLFTLDGCSQAEAAARLGCTAKAVEMRVYQGRKRLRQELEDVLNGRPPQKHPRGRPRGGSSAQRACVAARGVVPRVS